MDTSIIKNESKTLEPSNSKEEEQKKTYNVLILGASYGSLLATKLLLAGHNVTLVCRQKTAELINKEGTTVRIPIRGRQDPIEFHSKDLSGDLTASTSRFVSVQDYHLVVLAMSEPQYSADDEIQDLLKRIGLLEIPTMSIMNMPMLPYLKRILPPEGTLVGPYGIPSTDEGAATYQAMFLQKQNEIEQNLSKCYTGDGKVWKHFKSYKVTQCSSDPQAYRPSDEPANVLVVRLPTNFKAAKFHGPKDNTILTHLSEDIQNARFQINDHEAIEVPVKLRVHDSLFVPLSKWPMLMTGNYRCIPKYPTKSALSIYDAVWEDIDKSQHIYDMVVQICINLGGNETDFVPFEKYQMATKNLIEPSSVARALVENGATQIERVDKLILELAIYQQYQNPLDPTEERSLQDSKFVRNELVEKQIQIVDEWIAENEKRMKNDDIE